MKQIGQIGTILLSGFLLGLSGSAFAQGQVNLSNYNNTNTSPTASSGGLFFLDTGSGPVLLVKDFNASFFGGTDSANLTLLRTFAGASAAGDNAFGAGTFTDPQGVPATISGATTVAFLRIDAWIGASPDFAGATTKGSTGMFSNPVGDPPNIPDLADMPATVLAPRPPTTPGITIQPQGQVTCLGRTAMFSVSAIGAEPIGYQWRFGDAALNGETNAQLRIDNLQRTNAGTYSVQVSNAFGSVISSNAQLILNDACVDLRMYAGLNISGLEGATYVLKYTTDLSDPTFDHWISLATNTLTGSNWFYLDKDSPFSHRRFYGVKVAP
jgi:hypothetical protein